LLFPLKGHQTKYLLVVVNPVVERPYLSDGKDNGMENLDDEENYLESIVIDFLYNEKMKNIKYTLKRFEIIQ